MNLPSTLNPPRQSELSQAASPAVGRYLPTLPPEVTARLAEIRKALLPLSPGRFTIYEHAALSEDERAWLEDHLAERDRALQPASQDAAYERLERFAFGFGQLRGADPVAVRGTILNWCEAVEDKPLAAIDAACRAWNGRKLAWAKSGMVPNPDELARACAEMLTALKAEGRELQSILGAKVIPYAPPVTDAQRAANLRKLAALVIETPEVNLKRQATEPTERPARYSPGYLEELEARKAKRLAAEAADLQAKAAKPSEQESMG